MKHEHDILAALLGQIEALFEPCPDTNPARWQYQAQYIGGTDWPGPGEMLPLAWIQPGDAAGRKSFQRQLAALSESGLVRVAGRNAGLTEQGLDAARICCGHIALADALPGLDYMLSLDGTPHEWQDGVDRGFVSESSLCGGAPLPPGTPGKARVKDSHVVDMILPLLIAGYVQTDYCLTYPDLALYALTPRGRDMASERHASGKARPEDWLKLKIRHTEPDAWFTAWQATRAAIAAASPIQKHRIRHGLSVCIRPGGA